MKKGLIDIYDYFLVRKPLFYGLTIGLFIVAGLLASRIKIEEDVAHMMPNSGQTERINQIISHSRFSDNIIVKISGKEGVQPEELTAMADSLESKLGAQYGSQIANIKSRVDDQVALNIYKTVHNNLPFYLDEKDYAAIDTLLTPEHIQTALGTDYRMLTSASGLVMKRMIADDPIGISAIALKKLQSLQLDESYDLYDGYIVTKDRRNLLMFITPVNPPGETAKNADLVKGLGDIAKELNAGSKNAAIYYYGGTGCSSKQCQSTKEGHHTYPGYYHNRPYIVYRFFLPTQAGAFYYDVTSGVWRLVRHRRYGRYKRHYFQYCSGSGLHSARYCC